MIFTLFTSPLHQAFPDNVDDPIDSKIAIRFMGQDKFNILYKKVEQYALADGDTRAISYANYTVAEWAFIVIRVIGSAAINTVGVDTNGSTPIAGVLPVYGTSIFPGIGLLSTYNVTTFTVESFADNTQIELFAGISCEDDDTRLDLNA